MKVPFREYHTIEALQALDQQSLPLDVFLRNYFKNHKSIGAKDRSIIADTIYSLIRWRGLIEHFVPKYDWYERLNFYQSDSFKQALNDLSLDVHTRLSFPKSLFDLISSSYDEETTIAICQISNSPAPTFVRVNTLKTSRNELLEKWQRDNYHVIPSEHCENGIIFLKKINFFALDEFKKGLFEIQDENSQRLADLISAKPGDLILDYCSGSGGKSLAFAPKLEGKGQIFLHDIRPFILQMAKIRLKRAGIQNAQTILANDLKLKKLKKKMQWVLVDAPCSGTGTLRRNPDMKWKFEENTLKSLIGEQRTIFEKALSFLAPNGYIVYATCSILKSENEDQVDHFMKTYSLKLVQPYFKTLPKENEGDGFFGAVLQRVDKPL